MKDKNNTLSTNNFLTPKEQRIQGLGYYAEFFANLDFDDGFKYILLEQLFQYVSGLNDSSVRCQIVGERTSSTVTVIIEAPQIHSDTPKDIEAVSHTLQSRYHMTPLRQAYNLVDMQAIALPIRIERAREDSGYDRSHVQSVQANILQIEEKIESIVHLIDLLEGLGGGNFAQFISAQHGLLIQLRERQALLSGELQGLIANIYLERATRPINSVERTVSPIEASVEHHILGANESTQAMKDLVVIFSGQVERLAHLGAGQIAKMEQLLQSAASMTNSEILHTSGGLTDWEWVDKDDDKDWKIKSADLLGKKSNIYYDGSQVHGFRLPGLDSIPSLEVLSKNNVGIASVLRVNCGDNRFRCFTWNSEIGDYTPVELDGVLDFSKVRISENGGIYGVSYESRDSKGIRRLYTDNQSNYQWFSICGISQFVDIKVKQINSGGFPISGEFTLEDGKKRYFYTHSGVLKLLTIDGVDAFSDIQIRNHKDEYGTPLTGIVILENQKKQYFYDSKDGYSPIDADGVDQFDEIKEKDKYLYIRHGHGWMLYYVTSDPAPKRIRFPDNIIFNGNPIKDSDRYRYGIPVSGGYSYGSVDQSENGEYMFNPMIIEGMVVFSGMWGDSCKTTDGHSRYFIKSGNGYKFFRFKGHIDFKTIIVRDTHFFTDSPKNFRLTLLDGTEYDTRSGWNRFFHAGRLKVTLPSIEKKN